LIAGRIRHRSLAIALIALAIGVVTGEGYIPRLSNHDGYFLVAVAGEQVPPVTPPRHTYVIVIDGMRRDVASALRAVQTTGAHGQCVTTDVGPLSLSRPVYAVLSTGLEQDRTGSRNNATRDPLAADSIWARAREAGFFVSAYSELPWFQELFPHAFEHYVTMEENSDLFAQLHLEVAREPSLTLMHPVYVDETAHAFGAASDNYRNAAVRVDSEIMTLLNAIDWQRDLVVITADHGHADAGGHGGRQPETAFVLTCFGGRGVLKAASAGAFDMRAVAPTLSLLLGVPFPRHMRATDDVLDSAFTLVEPSAFPEFYLNERRNVVARFRAENLRYLETLGAESWKDFYTSRAQLQWARAGAAFIFVLGLIVWRARHLGLLAWIVLQWVLTASVIVVVTGGFDLTSIKQRGPFIGLTLAAASFSLMVFLFIHVRLMRARAIANDLRTLVIATSLACLAHVFVYGWPLGFPLPGPQLLFVPLVSAMSLGVYIAAFVIAEWRRSAAD
jgi:hypothetical protein